MSPQIGGRSIARQRMLSLVVAVACVAVAAVGLRLSDPADQKFQTLSGVLGQSVRMENGTLTVDKVTVGTSLTDDDQVTAKTTGMFVLVRLTGAADGPTQLSLNKARLLSGDHVYESYNSSTSIRVPPGFQTTGQMLFEVDPAVIDDLTLEIWHSEILVGYPQHARIHLGITPGNAQQWRDSAAGQGIVYDQYLDDVKALP